MSDFILPLSSSKSSTNNRFVKISSLVLSLLTMTFSSLQANAACQSADCDFCKPSQLQFATPALELNENGKYPISLEADDVQAQGQESVTLSGNAEVAQGRQTIVADELQYYRESDRVVANGNVEMISTNGDYLASDSIDVHAPTQIGSLKNTSFKLATSIVSEDGIDTVEIGSRGSAEIVDLEGEGLIRLKKARYTTCKEGNDDVVISAGEIALDQTSGIGKARNAVLRFKGLPIFYTPYLSFPINDQRKTGLLIPGFGSDEDSGNVVELPWYWNIAPNQDATVTPRYYTDRGLQVGAEYRRRSLTSDTYIYGEYMSEDEFYSEEQGDASDGQRDLLTVWHYQEFSKNISGRINYNDVSDIDYFDDLKNDIRYFSATYVPRDVSLKYSSKYLSVGVRANEYQIIDPIILAQNKPYERLPALTFSTRLPEGPWGMEFNVAGSYTNFSSESETRDEGKRTAITPSLELPLESIWGYVKPRVSVNHRSYSLNRADETKDDSPSFTVPIFSVDSGLYFEKNSSWFGESALHTLEPRVYYVYAPNEDDQNDAPVFDTSVVNFNNFGNIFRENRFYGEDRVGDTNQITIGATTRIIDSETGDQRLQASFGQLYLLDDLEQTLPNRSAVESGLGDFLAEVKTTSANSWTTYSFIQYDHKESEIRTASFAFGYQPKENKRKKVSVGYYYSNSINASGGNVDQLTLNVDWPISDRWQFFGSERYSLEDSESLYTTLGVEYNACCWKVRISGQERLQNRNIEEKKRAVFVELELTNLGRIRTGL